mmetsp:Transcript_6842/g.15460  ORF Transcript_6842/g.15460 Transcript_6842/m.15460 type:complete len:219 (-) Transcript_6842:12-668(-)
MDHQLVILGDIKLTRLDPLWAVPTQATDHDDTVGVRLSDCGYACCVQSVELICGHQVWLIEALKHKVVVCALEMFPHLLPDCDEPGQLAIKCIGVIQPVIVVDVHHSRELTLQGPANHLLHSAHPLGIDCIRRRLPRVLVPANGHPNILKPLSLIRVKESLLGCRGPVALLRCLQRVSQVDPHAHFLLHVCGSDRHSSAHQSGEDTHGGGLYCVEENW